MSTALAPIQIGRVALTVNDLPGLRDFYRRVIGLEVLDEDGGTARLGAGDRVLLELRGDRAAPRPTRGEAGLFHTAFLLPSRGALGRWLHHAAGTGAGIDGASDHLVSEAVYLSDPEGNGIEVYADRAPEHWPRDGGAIRLATQPMDVEGVLGAADGPWDGAPEGTVVGHVHLRVGDVEEAERFWTGTMGTDVMARYGGQASFLAWGGYHHHIGANVWGSRGAGRRTEGATGLAEVELLADADAMAGLLGRTGGAARVEDPWGTAIAVRPKG